MNKEKHNITEEEWEACKKYFNYECAYCSKSLEDQYNEINRDLCKDHHINSGSGRLDNCIPACDSCNCSKGNKEFEEWYKTKDFYSIDRNWKILTWLNYDYKKYIHANNIKEIIKFNTNKGQLNNIKNDKITLTKYLVKELKESGRSLTRVAKRIGISTYAFHYRVRNNFITVEELLAICNLLELPLTELHKIFPEY